MILAGALVVLSVASCSEGSTGPDNVVNVSIVDNEFLPDTVRISVGATVRWRNNGNSVHNVTSIPPDIWPTANLPRFVTSQNTFNTAGTFRYQCTFHQNHTGAVIVQ
jgi:plastocyanin